MNQPGVPLLRPVVHKGPFKAQAGAPKLPEGEARKKPPVDRSELTAADKMLAGLAEERAVMAADFAERRKALAAEERTEKDALAEREGEARRVLAAAKAAYRNAGGRSGRP